MDIIKSNFRKWYVQTPIGELCFDHEPKQDEVNAMVIVMQEQAKALEESQLQLEAEDGTIIG